ncbi:hypothetical protein E1267_01330 [Nonomuraea longispora]|uniref:Aminoglycoside phosphotransferase domain-containing protein n=1 Tax=Nonomuraea longispora TaxID=1848320 RepID=A0A4R4NNL2_9ACTN|nr:hypothetical protein [Nonomuraea longispora]TDC11101.1 hypothetical protein E1267_01330 [Nonomuraea longispora]
MTDAAVRLGYLAETVRLLYPGPGSPRPYTVLPHTALPRRLAPRRWWHVGAPVVVPVEGSIAAYLSEVFARPVETVLHVRPARRANRKPVLEARSEGRRLAFVKIGDSPRARELVAAEAAALRRLAGWPLDTVVAPRVLHHGCWKGLAVLALAPLPVRRGRVREPLRLAAIKEIAATGGPSPAWHGDLAPWNMCPSPDGRLLVWDWERYEIGVPYGLDALHHFFQRALRRMSPQVAARACLAQSVRVLAPLGVSASEARQTALRYLIALAGRHADDGHAPLGPPETWLCPVVDHEELLT